jgi:hypothetical protein
MKMYLALMLVVVSCGLVTAVAQEPGKTMRVTGRVVAIDDESITVKPGNNTLLLAVDASTRVTGKGVGTKLRSLKAEKKSARITDLVEENDSVIVEYRDVGNGALRATRVDVRVKAFKKQ